MGCDQTPVLLGRTGLSALPIGLGASYGIAATDVERAVERGVRWLYWGSRRAGGFGEGVVNAARQVGREKLVVVVQSYSRVGGLLGASLESALHRLKTDYADFLLLGWWNQPPPRRIVDAALALREKGRARHLLVSCHHRPTFARYAADPAWGGIMVRYNAGHPGAEEDVFPHLPADPSGRPAVVAYTATRWGTLLDPSLQPPGEPRPRASDCYRFALSHPAVDLVLAGPKDGAELDEALAALDRGPMSPEELAWMKRVGAHVKQRAGPATRGSPIELIDKVAGWFSSNP